ncbi:unnamed protein product [Fraxinus pennsylvanica]|uniref:Polygalacturonase n=1 Tax=Fraxinus pennsylvanica TaxID=56036 RepID=A0AAD1ZBR4_9LAMI|nr:unnamed protein product [Fraxinus pennsylvanica]
MLETSTPTSSSSSWWRRWWAIVINYHHHRRWIPIFTNFLSTHKTFLVALWLAFFFTVFYWQWDIATGGLLPFRRTFPSRLFPKLRPVVFNLTDFGAVGDGVHVNTAAFEQAIRAISRLRKRGGSQLNVPPGYWLTDEKYWHLMPPLPSYGYGREHPRPRYGSLIHGQNLKDVVITGYNGTINGQPQTWWKKYRQKLLNHTRGPLVQIMWSRDILISNITLQDSPFWTLHPYDCKNVVIRNLTILAPIFEAPNTDGIDPDSCEDMAFSDLVIRSMVSAGISIGSEMSGGVSNVIVENVLVWNSRRAVRIKTAPGRGGHVRNIIYRNLTFDNVRVGIVIKTDYNEHPDAGFDPKAVPILEDISYSSIHGEGVRVPVRIQGSEEIPVRNVSFRDMSVGITYKKKHIFQCAFVEGRVTGTVFPAPCENLDLYDEQGHLVKKSISHNISDIDYDF